MSELNWDHPNPHILHTRVEEDDIDGLQHTNNAVYVNWCEQVAWSHSVALGLDLDAYHRLDRAMAITRSEYAIHIGFGTSRNCFNISLRGAMKIFSKEFSIGFMANSKKETFNRDFLQFIRFDIFYSDSLDFFFT